MSEAEEKLPSYFLGEKVFLNRKVEGRVVLVIPGLNSLRIGHS